MSCGYRKLNNGDNGYAGGLDMVVDGSIYDSSGFRGGGNSGLQHVLVLPFLKCDGLMLENDVRSQTCMG